MINIGLDGLRSYPQKYIDAGRTLYENYNKPFVKRALMGYGQPIFGLDENGIPMTHLMSSIDNFVVPLLQYGYNGSGWNDLRGQTPRNVMDASFASNNFIEFNNPQAAENFSRDYHIIMDNPAVVDYVLRNKSLFEQYINKK